MSSEEEASFSAPRMPIPKRMSLAASRLPLSRCFSYTASARGPSLAAMEAWKASTKAKSLALARCFRTVASEMSYFRANSRISTPSEASKAIFAVVASVCVRFRDIWPPFGAVPGGNFSAFTAIPTIIAEDEGRILT